MRSLDAKMRRLLRALEVTQDLPGLASGEVAGIYPLQGKSYIELHDQAFRVEWVPQESSTGFALILIRVSGGLT